MIPAHFGWRRIGFGRALLWLGLLLGGVQAAQTTPLTRDTLILTVAAAAEAQAQVLPVELREKMVRGGAVNGRPLFINNNVRKGIPNLCLIECYTSR